MPKRFVSWMIGGPQGSGINVAAETLAKAFSRGGLHVFANIEYHSNIMGKHSYYRVRVSEEPVHAPVDEVHLLAALDEETLFGDHHHNPEFPTHHGHVHEVVPGGGIIYDADLGDIRERLGRDDLRLYPVPYFEMIRRALEPFGKAAEYRQYDIMRNTVALGGDPGRPGLRFRSGRGGHPRAVQGAPGPAGGSQHPGPAGHVWTTCMSTSGTTSPGRCAGGSGGRIRS